MGDEYGRKRENSSSNASFSIGHLLCTGHCTVFWTLQANNPYSLRVHCPVGETNRQTIVSHGNKYYNKSGFKMLLEQRSKLMNPAQGVSFLPPFSALNVQGHWHCVSDWDSIRKGKRFRLLGISVHSSVPPENFVSESGRVRKHRIKAPAKMMS